jgi:hypothetical protein
MLKVYAKQQYVLMEDELEQIAINNPEPLNRMTSALRVIRKSLENLFGYITKDPFKDKKEEVHFFKFIKPRFYAHYIFEVALYNLFTGKPRVDEEQLRAYYMDELRFIQRTFRQHAFLYQYHRLGATELDELYFVRGEEIQSVLIPEVPKLDNSFSTSGDYLFSKFKAYEMLQEYIAHELANIGKPEPMPFVRSDKNNKPLKWTGDKVNLVEVIYAIHFTGQLNNGNADISQVIQFMEKHLQIDLSRAYRDFIDIRNRKVSSPTRYIDQMRESIHKRIDDDLALKKSTRARLRSGN